MSITFFNWDTLPNYSSNSKPWNTLQEYKADLQKLWEFYMKAFNYTRFYSSKENQNHEKSKTGKLRNSALEKWNTFFDKYQIYFDNDLRLVTHKTAILKEVKVWIMYLIALNENESLQIGDVLRVLGYCCENKCDLISWFEFFLIFVSENQIRFQYFLAYHRGVWEEMIPEDFIELYRKHRVLWREIFKKKDENKGNRRLNQRIFHVSDDKENKENAMYLSNRKNVPFPHVMRYRDTNEKVIKMTDEVEEIPDNTGTKHNCDVMVNMSPRADINTIIGNNNYTVIDTDFLSKGCFVLIRKTANDTPGEGSWYYWIPLKKQFTKYKEKLDVKYILNSLHESETFRNFVYVPYDPIILSWIFKNDFKGI